MNQQYYTNGELDINKGYFTDFVRIHFNTDVTMFGVVQEDFNSDHFWNAARVDGQWYYVDPCYTDVFTEVMMRDRVETDGSMNHLYFLFSHPSCEELYEDNYKEIKTMYAALRAGESASTSAVNPEGWKNAIEKVVAAGEDALVMAFSSLVGSVSSGRALGSESRSLTVISNCSASMARVSRIEMIFFIVVASFLRSIYLIRTAFGTFESYRRHIPNKYRESKMIVNCILARKPVQQPLYTHFTKSLHSFAGFYKRKDL